LLTAKCAAPIPAPSRSCSCKWESSSIDPRRCNLWFGRWFSRSGSRICRKRPRRMRTYIVSISSTLESPFHSELCRVESRQQLECRIGTANRDCMKRLFSMNESAIEQAVRGTRAAAEAVSLDRKRSGFRQSSRPLRRPQSFAQRRSQPSLVSTCATACTCYREHHPDGAPAGHQDSAHARNAGSAPRLPYPRLAAR
jgi:hypothetical protein